MIGSKNGGDIIYHLYKDVIYYKYATILRILEYNIMEEIYLNK